CYGSIRRTRQTDSGALRNVDPDRRPHRAESGQSGSVRVVLPSISEPLSDVETNAASANRFDLTSKSQGLPATENSLFVSKPCFIDCYCTFFKFQLTST